MKKSALKKLTAYTPSQDSSKLVKIGQASELLGVSIDTLRRWEKKGWLKATKTPGGTRLYDREQLIKLNPNLKRGPKSLISPLISSQAISPAVKNSTANFSQNKLDNNITLNTQTDTNIPNTDIKLATDRSILKTVPTLSAQVIEAQINEQEELNTLKNNILSDLVNPFRNLKSNLIALALTVLIISALVVPGLFLTKYIKNTQTASVMAEKYHNIPLLGSADLAKTIAGIFSPTLSHRFFNSYQAGSPPGILTDKNKQTASQLASGRVSGDIKGVKTSGTNGDVLAESSPSGSFLQINIDAELNGNLAVDGEGFFTQKCHSSKPALRHHRRRQHRDHR